MALAVVKGRYRCCDWDDWGRGRVRRTGCSVMISEEASSRRWARIGEVS